MSDKELLELAAKAAGIAIAWDARGPYTLIQGISGNGDTWNPLTDDGDALRLAVKLGLFPMPFDGFTDVVFRNRPIKSGITEPHNGDRYAATRRAIVRAAAEMAQA